MKIKLNIPKVSQFHNKNQYLIRGKDFTALQSYDSIVVVRTGGKIYLDSNTWDYSKTTGKHRNLFLGEDKKDTEKKIKSGEYILTDLNL